MSISEYLRDLRASVGNNLLMVPAVTALIRDDEGRLLFMLRSDDGTWGLPAGGIEPGESPATAVVREVREETGLHVRPVRVAGVFGGELFRHTYENGDEVEFTVVAFECETIGGKLEPLDGEAIELRFFSPEEAPPLRLPYPRSLLSGEAGVGQALF